MTITIDGNGNITNSGGYTGDGISFADATPTNTLVTTTTGRVGIGTNSPTGPLTVVSAISGEVIRAQKIGGTNLTLLRINMNDTLSTGTIEVTGAAGNPALCLATAGVERLRINDAGSVGIGTDNPQAKLQVYGAIRAGALPSDATNASISMYNDGTGVSIEAFQGNNSTIKRNMWLNAYGGGVAIGSSDPGAARLLVKGTGNTSTTLSVYVQNSVNTNSFLIRDDLAVSFYGVATSWNTSSGPNVYMDTNGYIYRQTSSERYKENIADTPRGLIDVLKLRAVTFTSKSETDGDTIFGGMIAEEVHEAGLTEFVMYDDEGRPDALHYASMVSLAFKAIQEQQAIIEDLRTRLAAVEGVIQ